MSFVRNLFFSVFLGVWGTLSAQEERVIPVPREVLPGTGEFRMSEVTAWHTNLSGAEKESLVNYAAAELSTGRQEWHGKDHTGKDVVFFQKISDAGIHPEGYVLEVKPEIVTVSASTATGLFYGLQSLLQLMKPDERGGWTVPAVTVKDSPRFGYRGFMIDVSRHFRPKEFVKKQIDAMARYKFCSVAPGSGMEEMVEYCRWTQVLRAGGSCRSRRVLHAGGYPGAGALRGGTPYHDNS